MKERPILFSGPMVRAILEGHKTQTRRVAKIHGYGLDDRPVFGRSPFGEPGDRLWVREKWAILQGLGLPLTTPQPLHYMADITDRRHIEDYTVKPSIHMPRWASRLTLEVTAVRRERLRDITEDDARAEGVAGLEKWLAGGTEDRDPDSGMESAMILSPRFAFQMLWIEIYGADSWRANPWVDVCEFRKAVAQ